MLQFLLKKCNEQEVSNDIQAGGCLVNPLFLEHLKVLIKNLHVEIYILYTLEICKNDLYFSLRHFENHLFS